MKKLALARKRYEAAKDALMREVCIQFPIGSPCFILWKNGEQRIPGVIESGPSRWWTDPKELSIRTDKRGTLMRARYDSIMLR